MKIAVGSDHGGFALKEAVKKHLEAKGIEVGERGLCGVRRKGRALRGRRQG